MSAIRKRAIAVLTILPIVWVLGACTTPPVVTPPAATATVAASIATLAITPTPEPQPSPTPEPTATTQPTAAAANPLGLPDGIPEDAARLLFNYDTDVVDQYNSYFDKSISADMDGDGTEEKVELIPEKKKLFGDSECYTGLKIRIGGRTLSLTADKGFSFGPSSEFVSGTVVDLDKNDGKMELVVGENNYFSTGEVEPSEKYYLISDVGGELKAFAKLDFYPEATGTGYVIGTKYTKTLAGGYQIGIYVIRKYLPGTGFEEVESKLYRTASYTSFPPEDYEGYPTEWEQKIAAGPKGEKSIALAKSTEIYFGLYDPDGWIEVHGAQGDTLGWLDLNEVDIDKYIGYAVEASCH